MENKWLKVFIAACVVGIVTAFLNERQWHPAFIGLLSGVVVGMVFYVLDRLDRRIAR
jgi:hypothetical protein